MEMLWSLWRCLLLFSAYCLFIPQYILSEQVSRRDAKKEEEEEDLDPNLQICQKYRREYNVIPNVSWGKLQFLKQKQLKWKALNCNELLEQADIAPPPAATATNSHEPNNNTKLDVFSLCTELQREYQIIPEVSWGKIQHNPKVRMKWNNYECNTIIKFKRSSVDCDELHGEKFLIEWRRKESYICVKQTKEKSSSSDDEKKKTSSSSSSLSSSSSRSYAYCQTSIRDNIHCYFPEAIINIDHIHPSSKNSNARKPQRMFYNGYLTFPNCQLLNKASLPPGYEHFQLNVPTPIYSSEPLIPSSCSLVVDQPILIVSHDHVYNLGHLFEDIMNWWLISELSELSLKDLSILNIDGLKQGTIISGKGRYVSNLDFPDGFGPFKQIFDVLFHQTYSLTLDFPSNLSTICFTKGVYFYPMPVKGFLWEKFESIDPCSKQLQPSYIYEHFHKQYLQSWMNYGSLLSHYESIQTASNPPIPIYSSPSPSSSSSFSITTNKPFTILLLERKIDQKKDTPIYYARTFLNLEEIKTALILYGTSFTRKNNHNNAKNNHHPLLMKIYSYDITQLTFAQQVAFMYFEIDLLIGFHGAGINHLFHLNAWRPNCCGVIEIFPQKEGCDKEAFDSGVCFFAKRKGHGNHARYLGYRYRTIQADDYSFVRNKGTTLKPRTLVNKIDQTISRLVSRIVPWNVSSPPADTV